MMATHGRYVASEIFGTVLGTPIPDYSINVKVYLTCFQGDFEIYGN